MDIIPASVLVIESHPLMREALCAAITEEPGLKVWTKAGSSSEALQMLAILLPDIILFAMGTPGSDELKALKRLREALPETPILALISYEMPGQEQAALEAGACAVLNKAASRAELINKLIEIGTVSMLNDVDVNSEKEADTKQPSSYLYLHRKNCKPEDRLAHLQERKK